MIQSDLELLKKGDPSALAKIHARYSKRIFGVGYWWIRDKYMVENFVQDTFLVLWERKDRIENPDHLIYFLNRVMTNKCLQHSIKPRTKFFRKRVRRFVIYDDFEHYLAGYDPEIDHENLCDQETQQENYERVIKALPLLSDKSRRLIELGLKYGFKFNEVRKVMGISKYSEIQIAFQELKGIIHGENSLTDTQNQVNSLEEITETQEKILELRFKKKHSFADIAKVLKLPVKEVHKEFSGAYKLWQGHEEQQLKSS